MPAQKPYTYDPVGQHWSSRIMARCRELGMGCTKVADIWGYKTCASVRARTSWSFYFVKLRNSTEKCNRHGYPLTVDGNEEKIKAIRHTSVCASCGVHENDMKHTGRKNRLCLDHCHETGEPRALLCGNCNIAEGLFEGHPEDLLKLYEYMTNSSLS